MRRTASVVTCALLLLLCVAVSAPAQETRGSVEGTVRDTSGAVLPGATVEAKSPALVGTASTVSDPNGLYRFPALAPGVYVVTASLTGFQPAKVENIQLQLGQILKVDFAMAVGSVTETLQVTAESPLIDVKQNTAAVSIQADLIDRIPKGRDFTSIVTSASGVNDESRGGGIMVDGASGSENRYMVDGMDTTALRTGTSNKEVLTDFLSEVQVKSSGYNAEYRAATGGVISAITKTGSNVFHGGLGSYYTNNKWLGDVRGSIRLVPTDTTRSEYTYTARDEQYTYEPVMDLGGPIVPNRLWFFAGFIPQVTETRRTVRFTENNSEATFDNPTRDNNVNWNVTGQAHPNVRFRINGINERNRGGVSLPSKDPDGTSPDAVRLFPNPQRTDGFNDLYSGVIDWVVTPKTYVNITSGYLSYGSRGKEQQNPGVRRTFTGSTVCTDPSRPGTSACPFPEIPAALQQRNSYFDARSNSFTMEDDYSRFNVSADLTSYRTWKGQHSLKAGVLFERYANDVNAGQQGPNVALNWNASRTTLEQQVVRGTYGYYVISQQYTLGSIHSQNVGLFVQDSWTLGSRLTLNYGVRAESERIPSYQPQNPGLKFGWGDKIAPRLGFAYDLRGDSRWKVYGSWGMFYDIFKLELPRGSFGGDRWISYYWTLDNFNWPAINCDGKPTSACPGRFIEQVDFRHVSNEAGAQLIDPNLKPYRAQELTVGMDHELTRLMSLQVRYAHKWLDRTIEDAGIQVPGVGEVFYIVNVGEGLGEKILGPQYPSQPKPERTYDGVEFRVRRRLANSWSLNTSLLFSRLYGNYSGLASSDENGRTSPNVNRFFDGLHMSFDQTGTPIYGRLQTDRPVQFELQATYQTPWGTGIGTNFFAWSGTPLQSQATIQGVPVLYKGRGDLGRTPGLNQTDINLWHEFRLPGHTQLQFLVNAINVFDQDTATGYGTSPYRDAIPTTNDQFFGGTFNGDAVVQARNSDTITTNNIRLDPRFQQPSAFQGARSVRVMAKFRF